MGTLDNKLQRVRRGEGLLKTILLQLVDVGKRELLAVSHKKTVTRL